VWSASRPGRFTPEKAPIPIVQEAWWTPGPVWTCAKNLSDPRAVQPVASRYTRWAMPARNEPSGTIKCREILE
jgi:hypothetical protein